MVNRLPSYFSADWQMDYTAQLLLLCGLPHAIVGSLSDAWYLSDRFGSSCHVTERNVVIIIVLKI